MITIIINIITNILMFFSSPTWVEVCEKINEMDLCELEETVDLPFTKILDDILADYNAHDQNDNNIYVFGISKFGQGLRIGIHKEAKGKINGDLEPLGYIQHGGNTIIIVADNWVLEEGFIRFPEKPDRITITTESRHPGIIYDPDSWLYSVREGNYSRLVEGIGWVWTMCNQKTDRNKLHRFLIEAPKRTKNKSSR